MVLIMQQWLPRDMKVQMFYLFLQKKSSTKEWILDSRCYFHITLNQVWFDAYKEIDGGRVLMVDNMACKVIGIDTIKIKMIDGFITIFKDVRHEQKLKRNMISLGICWIK